MMLMRRGLIIGAFTVVSCALISCSSSENGEGASDRERAITIWAHHGRERENAAMQSIIEAFNAAHAAENIRAEITFFPDRQYAEKIAFASVSRSLPDVVDIDGPFVGPWAADGLIVPIDDLASPDLLDDMLPSLIEQGTYRDSLYALGAFDSALVVYYNRDMIEAAGLSPPESIDDAWSWDQFISALEAVRPHATIPLSLHMDDEADEWFTYAFSPLIWSNGGALIDTERNRVVGVLDGPPAVEAVRRWQDLFTDGLAEATSTNPNPFGAGLAAFDWNGHWYLPTFEQTEGLRFGVMPLPRMGDAFVAPSGSWCWGLSRDCDDPELAFTLIEWLLDPEHGIKPIVEANGAVPGRKSAFALFPEYESMPRRLFREQLVEAARARPRTAVYRKLTSEFAAAMRDIALGSDVQQRLTEAAEAVQRTADRRDESDT